MYGVVGLSGLTVLNRVKRVIVLDVVICVWCCSTLKDTVPNTVKLVVVLDAVIVFIVPSGFERHYPEQRNELLSSMLSFIYGIVRL